MINIYCIEDCDGLKYVGSTKQTLKKRFKGHKCKSGNFCSSRLLNMEKSQITLLETCDISERKERESYWINKLDCVNVKKLNFNKAEYNAQYRNRNIEKEKEYIKQYKKNRRSYTLSWGGDLRADNNNLLKIDIDNLF